METLLSDLRYAARTLLRAPTFTIAAVLALGLGVGSAAGVFSLLEAVVLRPLPYAQPDRLVMLWEANREKGLDHQQLSPVNFMDYRAQTEVFADAAAWWYPQINLADDETGDPIRVTAVETSENLFQVLGVRPLVGPGFDVDTTLFGDVLEATISHRLWQSRFHGDPKVIGRSVRLNGFSYTIVGVMPQGFGFPGETDLWQRLRWDLRNHSRGAHFMEAVARLRPAATPAQANRQLDVLTSRLARDFSSTNRGWVSRAVSLDREIAGVFRPALYALLGASALLLLIACINVANLLLARATSRRREVALRAAIGASRRRLVRLFLTESALLAVLGGLVGVAIAYASVKGLLAWSPIEIPRSREVSLNRVVLLFAAFVALVTALAFGLVPALLMSRAELQDALKDGAKGSGLQGQRMRNALVVSEVALAVMLLAGSGLLIRSVARLLHEESGVDATSVLTANIQLPDRAYEDWERVATFYSLLGQGLRARPEIVAAGSGSFLPLSAGWRMSFSVVGAAPLAESDAPVMQHLSVDEGYFTAQRVPLLRGRDFSERDDAKSPPVVIINEAAAKQLFPGQDAVGKRLSLRARGVGPLGRRLVKDDEHTIVGVVRDVKNTSIKSAAEPAIYVSARQFPFRKMYLVVRGRGDPVQLASLIRAEVKRIDPTLPIAEVRTLDRVLAVSADPPRFVMLLMTAFAALALTLAAVGIYGILTYTVTHRRQEIGIRMALGAEPSMVLRMIVREGLTLVVVGCALGVVGVLLAARSLAGFLYGVTFFDPMTLGGVLLVVVSVAVLACLVPGRRAAREDPAGALRAS